MAWGERVQCVSSALAQLYFWCGTAWGPACWETALGHPALRTGSGFCKAVSLRSKASGAAALPQLAPPAWRVQGLSGQAPSSLAVFKAM